MNTRGGGHLHVRPPSRRSSACASWPAGAASYLVGPDSSSPDPGNAPFYVGGVADFSPGLEGGVGTGSGTLKVSRKGREAVGWTGRRDGYLQQSHRPLRYPSLLAVIGLAVPPFSEDRSPTCRF